jgi:hypothetical protein
MSGRRSEQIESSTNVLTSALEWRPVSEQQDVNEFWVMLHEHLNVEHENTANANLLNDLFQGEYLWTMHCHGCKKNVSYRLEPFLNIELEVPSRDGPTATGIDTGGPYGAAAVSSAGGGVGVVNRADPHHRQAAHASAQRLGRRPRGRGVAYAKTFVYAKQG